MSEVIASRAGTRIVQAMAHARRAAWCCAAVGLLAVAAPPRATAASMPLLVHFACAGQDPPWSLEIAASSGRLTRPAVSGAAVQELSGTMQRPAQLEPAWAVWRGHTRAGAYTIVATLREESCRPQPDAAPAPYRVLVSFPDGSAAAGCCQAEQRLDARAAVPAVYAAKPPDDWSHSLPELLPAITACLRASRQAAVGVSYAGVADGVTSVRLVDADGSRSECRVDAGGAPAPLVTPLSGDAEAGWPLYLPLSGQAPQRRCGRLEQVLGARHILVGYLYYPDGCDTAPG